MIQKYTINSSPANLEYKAHGLTAENDLCKTIR